ncbi:porin, OprB family [Rhizobiales bacterium GAS191]|nr:porin, OprB family [Rhizobiales bacterium GAS113]SEF15728.1 porin, OprB family [Rhizobiales bacterium GAS191]
MPSNLVQSIRPLLVLAICLVAGRALADDSGSAQPALAAKAAPQSIWQQDTLLGDMGGFRTKAAEAGIQLGLTYTADFLGNTSGGWRRSFIAEGVLAPTLDMDLGKFTKIDALSGTSLHASLFQVAGRSISLHNTGALYLATNIEQVATTRVFEAYLEQKLFGDKISVRAGQMAIDSEFLISPTAATFISNTFYYPTWMAFDLPNGGAGTPLAAPAARVKYTPTDRITLMAGAYAADPAGRRNLVLPAPFSNPEYKNRYGTTFNLNYGTVYIAEAAYADAKAPLPFAYKIGGWVVGGGRFFDQRRDLLGFSLADLANTDGAAKRYSSDWGVYGIADQTLWAPGGNDPRKIAAFARGGLSPSNRNLIDAYADGGVTFTGFVPGRSNDVFGVAATYSKISSAASALDRDTILFGTNPPGFPIRDYEFIGEATYQIVLAPWLTVQLDAQHIVHPGGHVLASQGSRAGLLLKNESIFGVRTQVKF